MDVLISKDRREVYHITSRNLTTPFEFAADLLLVFFPNSNPSNVLKKGLLSEFNKLPSKALRPVKRGLKTDKIASMGFVLKNSKEGNVQIFE